MGPRFREDDRKGTKEAERLGEVRAFTMASRTEIGVIYGAAIVQGLALVTFPAASSIFTSPDGFGFDSTRYGTMFVPQVALAILASALAPRLARRWSLRRVLLAGFAGNVVSMALLALSRLLLGAPDMAFALLLVATAALGFGFGATVMALNTYAEAFFPEGVDRAVLVLNALLGVGTALAPVLVAAVLALGAWWLLPVAVACVFVLLVGIASMQPLRAETGDASTSIGWMNLPERFWLYAAAVFVYGILETLNGNWAMLYLTGERGVSARGAAFALAAFWLMVTLGRVAVAMIARYVPARRIYAALPVLLLITFQIVSHVQGQAGGLIALGLAGLACSAFLPLSISFGGKEFPHLSALMAGELIAFYQLGYGVAAFAIGPLHDPGGLAFATIFSAGSLVALPLVLIAYFIVRRPL
jgi:MFS transporter, FHS family, glucose/mannose:H+ symporter